MKRRKAAAVVLVAAVAIVSAIVVSGTSGANKKASADSITVWLNPPATTAWPGAIDAATKALQAKHPGAQVNVELQDWTQYLTKLDAALAGGSVPDVVEMGNTDALKYLAAGAFTDLSSARSTFPNSKTWLAGLTASGVYNGKLYAIPYYAGARALIYRKDLYKRAGIKRLPKTLDEFDADGAKLMKKFGKDPNFSAFYYPGRNWHNGMAWVYDYGGQIAIQKKGKWTGTLEQPKAVAGLTRLKKEVLSLSRASRTIDEAHPFQALVFAKGHVASYLANGWEWGQAITAKGGGNPALASKMAAYPMPSHIKGRYLPTFIGGSVLAIPAASKNKSLAIEWLRYYTSTANEILFAKAGNIANTTTLAAVNKANPQLYPFALAAKYSWYIPNAKNWATVEHTFVLENMLVSIFTGKSSVQSAAKKADSQINKILNTS